MESSKEYEKMSEDSRVMRDAIKLIKPYLEEKGLDLTLDYYGELFFEKAKTSNETIDCAFISKIDYYFTRKNNIFYLEISQRKSSVKMYLDEPITSNNNLLSPEESENYNYRIVFDDAGKVLVDLAEKERTFSSVSNGISFTKLSPDYVFLDDNNILIPRKDQCDIENSDGEKNIYEHYRIENGNAKLIHKFPELKKDEYNHDLLETTSVLKENKLIKYNEKIYNFELGKVLDSPNFDNIYSLENESDLRSRLHWYLNDLNLDLTKLVEFIENIVKENSYMVGFSEVVVEKYDRKKDYKVFAFLDKNGSVVDNLFYVDNNRLKKIKTFNKTFDHSIDILKKELEQKIDKEIEEIPQVEKEMEENLETTKRVLKMKL